MGPEGRDCPSAEDPPTHPWEPVGLCLPRTRGARPRSGVRSARGWREQAAMGQGGWGQSFPLGTPGTLGPQSCRGPSGVLMKARLPQARGLRAARAGERPRVRGAGQQPPPPSSSLPSSKKRLDQEPLSRTAPAHNVKQSFGGRTERRWGSSAPPGLRPTQRPWAGCPRPRGAASGTCHT